MVSWSGLGRSFGVNFLRNSYKSPLLVQNSRFSITQKLKDDHGHREFVIQPSRWQWHKFKDMLHYYMMVGLIPVGAIIFYTNIFIGPAQLQDIPEGYTPKHWEYHRHPITRFIARYIHNNPQQDYEKFMHYIGEEAEKASLIGLEKKIKAHMAERNDYQAYYYKPAVNKYLRQTREVAKETEELMGDNLD